ncbi:hypothetical protein T484DRAFT_1766401, partial [Baffinella frigidus]
MGRYGEMQKGGEQIHANLNRSQKVLRANRGSPQFKAYVDYINGILINGLAAGAIASLEYLLRQIDPDTLQRSDINPLLEVQLRLTGAGVTFVPPLGHVTKSKDEPSHIAGSGHVTKSKDGGAEVEVVGIRDTVLKWLNGFCNTGLLIRRLDTQNMDGDYLADVQENLQVRNIMALVVSNEERCEEFRHIFQ